MLAGHGGTSPAHPRGAASLQHVVAVSATGPTALSGLQEGTT